jgi:DNA invertase Pin-like site-specific DNA recombinase
VPVEYPQPIARRLDAATSQIRRRRLLRRPHRPAALQRLLADVRSGAIDVIVVYKVDRLPRSPADLAKLVELYRPVRLHTGAAETEIKTTPDSREREREERFY